MAEAFATVTKTATACMAGPLHSVRRWGMEGALTVGLQDP